MVEVEAITVCAIMGKLYSADTLSALSQALTIAPSHFIMEKGQSPEIVRQKFSKNHASPTSGPLFDILL
jgi:hypothetical protein